MGEKVALSRFKLRARTFYGGKEREKEKKKMGGGWGGGPRGKGHILERKKSTCQSKNGNYQKLKLIGHFPHL